MYRPSATDVESDDFCCWYFLLCIVLLAWDISWKLMYHRKQQRQGFDGVVLPISYQYTSSNLKLEYFNSQIQKKTAHGYRQKNILTVKFERIQHIVIGKKFC